MNSNAFRPIKSSGAIPEDEKLYDYSPNITALQFSEGLAGTVWMEREQILWNASEDNNNFVRRGAAKSIGLKAVLGIPLIYNDEMVGVIKIGTMLGANLYNTHHFIIVN